MSKYNADIKKELSNLVVKFCLNEEKQDYQVRSKALLNRIMELMAKARYRSIIQASFRAHEFITENGLGDIRMAEDAMDCILYETEADDPSLDIHREDERNGCER